MGTAAYREAGSCGPGAVTGNADDGTLVNVAGADEAFGKIRFVSSSFCSKG